MPRNARIRPAILARFKQNQKPATAATLAREIDASVRYVRSETRLMWRGGELVVRGFQKTRGAAARCFGLPLDKEQTPDA